MPNLDYPYTRGSHSNPARSIPDSTPSTITIPDRYYIDAPQPSAVAPDHLPSRLCPDPARMNPATEAFPMRISPHILSRMRTPDDPLARQFIPDPKEMDDASMNYDPLNETGQSPSPLIVHRYPRRVIFLVSNRCAAHCRFCMRKRHAISGARMDSAALRQGLTYLRDNRRINEAILSGGDPLMLRDAVLLKILTALRSLTHLRILRIHTRMPIVWPQRFTPFLVERLAAYRPLYINVHVNHPDELTPESIQALGRLADAGIPLGSQTVLLRNVNDRVDVLDSLFENLLVHRVRPNYLHQVDRVPGTTHFLVPMDTAMSLLHRLHATLSGLAVPRFMIDLPGGGGKVQLLPECIVDKQAHRWEVVNYRDQRYVYQPADRFPDS
jgi:lysine 2,3-aminomutase